MISLTPRFSRFNPHMYVVGVVCLATILSGGIFVAAHRNSQGNAPVAHAPNVATPDASTKAKIAKGFGQLPLSFEINKGQTDSSVKFLAHGPGYDLFLTATEAVLGLRKPKTEANVREVSVLRLKMIGANAAARVEGRDEMPGKVNYFIGNDPEKWRRNLPTYRKVCYTDVYPGIDIVYYGNQRELEYDFVVAAGANPKLIRFNVEGAERIRLDKKGNLLLALKHGEVQLNKPFIYQLNDEGSRREVKGSYVIKGSEIRFNVRGADAGKPLVIDPVLSYSTYLGGNGIDQALGIAVDAQGSAYITGTSSSIAFPTTPGAFNPNDLEGAFVTKLDPTGSTLVYSTFISGREHGVVTSGSPFTRATAIAVDSSGNAHITGSTTATDFPVVNPLKTSGIFFKTTDAASNWSNNSTGLIEGLSALAVSRSSPNTLYAGDSRGVYRSTDAGATWTITSTVGLPQFPLIRAIAIDPTNASVVYAGSLSGLFKTTDGGNNWNTLNIPVSGASVTSIVFVPSTPSTIYAGSNEGVFRSTDSGGTWTTLNNFDVPSVPHISSLAIDPGAPSTIYAGTQGSGLFKTTNGGNSWEAINNGINSGSGTNPAVIDDVVIDASNSSTLYIKVGSSRLNKSTNGGASWSLINQQFGGGINAFVGDHTNHSTLYVGSLFGGVFKTTDGGTSWTTRNTGLWTGTIRVLAIDPANSAILYAGGSEEFLVTDAFASKLNSSGSDLLFSTYLGGSGNEVGNGIAVDGSGNIYVTGNVASLNFPTVNAFQPAPPTPTTSVGNAFVTKINPAAPSFVFSTYFGGSALEEANSIAIDPATNVYVTGTTLSTNFPIANAFQPNIGDSFTGDAFVTKFNSNGSLGYSTYLGGNSTDRGVGIAVDVSGNAYVAGVTLSPNFPTANAIQATHGLNNDAFVTKLNSQGSALVYSTYLGGGNTDVARGIAVDATGNAYVTGFTSSLNFPLVAGAVRTRSSLFKSTDSATNWSNDNYGLTSEVTHLVVHPTQPLTLYAGTGIGVFRSTNGGKTWAPINNGLNARFVMALVIDPLTPTTLYVATLGDLGSGTSGVYKSTDGGNSWNRRVNGMAFTNLRTLAIDPVTPTTLYASTLVAPLVKTTNGADTWAQIFGGLPPFSPPSLAVDPHTPTRIFAPDAVVGGIFRSIDSGATWQSVLSQSSAERIVEGFSVSVSPVTPGLVYATLKDVGLFRSVDAGDNWTFVRPGNGKIVFDPVSASTLYFLSNTEGVLKSTDNGLTWIPRNNGLTGPSAVELVINPLRPSTLYLATASTNDEDAFVTKINPAGSAFIYSTFIGGGKVSNDSLIFQDEAFAIAVDPAGNAYITGFTRSPDFPTTPNAFQTINLGFFNTFISKLTMSHVISGHVLEAGGAPVNGADVVLDDGESLTALVTEADGAYEFSHLREGGSFTVSAAKVHFTMAPASQTFNNLNSSQTLDFTATATNAPFHTIGGQVSDNGIGLSGVTVTLSGSQPGVRITDSNGNYSFEVAGGGNYTVTPSILGFTFGPPSQTFNNLSTSQTANFAATRQSLVVTNTNNHGTGSLREAITNANEIIGRDTIVFNIPGPGVKVINLITPLPEITDSVVIDGFTQPGYAGSPVIELDGSSLGFESGLVITTVETTVRGLAIGHFGRAGIELRAGVNVIQGNYIGVDATGSQERPNFVGILLLNASNNVIGGTSAAARNVISGNVTHGLEIRGNGNDIEGNFIGTNAAGTAEIGNGDSGVLVNGNSSFTNNRIGRNTQGGGNLISGNSRGISIENPASGSFVQGNLIGTDITGSKKIPNAIGVQAEAPNTLIGGLTVAARNIISGNGTGVVIGREGSRLLNNFIGTDITGTLPLGNTFDGVIADNGALIGGTNTAARNVISGNGLSNLSLGVNAFGPGVTVQGNFIGTDVTGNRALPALFVSSTGIAISGSGNVIGGPSSDARNVISGNAIGIRFRSSNVGPPQGNIIQGNFIGLNVTGTEPVPNTQGGVEFFQGLNNVLGGPQSAAANKIAFNGAYGVMVSSLSSGNIIRRNSIFSNDGLGIDLGASGVTANDSNDSDTGANNLQNFPVLTSVSSIGSNTTIQGSLNSTPNTTFQIDFYTSAAVDPSGNGEGAQFLGTTPVNTDGNGNATFNVSFPVALGTGRVVTATATDPNGNTSEFSAGDAAGANGSVQFSVNSVRVIEDIGVANISVVRNGGSAGTLTVDFATTDGTAIAGQNYTATSGTLTFSGGETIKNIQIPILDDAITQPTKNFTVTLRNTPSLESLGVPNTLVVIVSDRSINPLVLVENTSVVEGETGSTTEMLFTLRLFAATGRTVSVDFATANISATGGSSCSNQGADYETASGTVTFQPGETALTIPVKICGDTRAEANETFNVNLSNPSNAALSFLQPVGSIIDDDVFELLSDDSGPTVSQAAALDSILLLRDPFRVVGIPDWFPTGPDRNTRVIIFVRNLELNPGESPSAVIVRLENSSQFFNLSAEDVRLVPNVDFAQVLIRLPDDLLPGTCSVTVHAHGRVTNTGTIRIAP